MLERPCRTAAEIAYYPDVLGLTYPVRLKGITPAATCHIAGPGCPIRRQGPTVRHHGSPAQQPCRLLGGGIQGFDPVAHVVEVEASRRCGGDDPTLHHDPV